jgi:hypothetical protein
MVVPKTSTGISDDSVRAKTGKTWVEWFALLDKAGAKSMPHKEIAAYIDEHYKVSGWWCQMVTVGYERERGLRQVHETLDGFHASVSKTMAVPLSALFAAWTDAKARSRWLGPKISVRKTTPEKTILLTWNADKIPVQVHFYPKGDAKSQIVVEQSKLASESDVTRFKAHWSKVLETLKKALEG